MEWAARGAFREGPMAGVKPLFEALNKKESTTRVACKDEIATHTKWRRDLLTARLANILTPPLSPRLLPCRLFGGKEVLPLESEKKD